MTTDESLAEYLNGIGATRDVVQQALRYYLSEETGDLPGEEMREELSAAATSETEVDKRIALLSTSSEELEQAALIYFSVAWQELHLRPKVRAAVNAANKSLPVIESMVLATVVMYAMYLLATTGKAKETRIVRRNPDGSFDESVETVYASPKLWLQAVLGLFQHASGTNSDEQGA